MGNDVGPCMPPRSHETRMDSTVHTLGSLHVTRFFTGGFITSIFTVVISARIWNVFLRNGGQVYDGVCDRICAPEGNNYSWGRWGMGDSYITAAIR